MEPRKAISKKYFVSEEENNHEKGINLTWQNRTSNIDWFKCGYECKPKMIFVESFCLLLQLKHWSVREVSRHSALLGNYPLF